jgi:adenylate kinase
MVVILLGPPGVGKGTQGVRLTESLGWSRISTGDLLREARREGTPLGLRAKAYMDAGELVPDDLILEMVRDTLAAYPRDQGIIFDGFPRTTAQAEALDLVLPTVGRRVDRVVVLEAPDEVLVRRVSGRRVSPSGHVYNVHYDPPRVPGKCDHTGADLEHRPDDHEDTVRRRLEVYREQTEPLIRFYEVSEARVLRVDGDRDMASVEADVRSASAGPLAGGA